MCIKQCSVRVEKHENLLKGANEVVQQGQFLTVRWRCQMVFGEPGTLRTSLDGKVCGRHNGAVMSVATAVAAFILLVGIIAANMLVKLNININIKE